MKGILLTVVYVLLVVFAFAKVPDQSLTFDDLKKICKPQENYSATYPDIAQFTYTYATDNNHQYDLVALPYYKDRGSPGKTILGIGIVTIAVGAPVLGASFMYLLIVRKEDRGNALPVMAGTGGGLLVAGITLIIIGSHKIYKDRHYGFISPKPNEIGFAYNF